MTSVPQEVNIGGSDVTQTKRSRRSKKDRKEKKTKKSGVRTKFLLESLRQDYYSLQEQNEQLREIIRSKLPGVAEVIIAECCPPRKKVTSIDELGEMMPNMSIEEGDEEEEEE